MNTSKNIKLSVVVPCYNEQGNVKTVYEECSRTFEEHDIPFELIFVNDGSTDKTMNRLREVVLKSITDRGHRFNTLGVKVIDFSRNFGKDAAIMAGLEAARGEYTVIMDGDMQQSPDVVTAMYWLLEARPELDCVAAVQKVRHEGAVLSFFKKSFYNIINKLSSVDFVSGASDFRMMRRPMVEAVLSLKEYYRFSKGIFSYVGFNTYYLPYEAQERKSGQTKWSFRKLFSYAIDGIIGFTTAPLKLVTILGSTLSVLSFIYLAIVVCKRIFWGDPVQGFATIVGCILLIGGLQLLGMGIIGEYLGRTYMETKRRPVYIQRQILDSSNISEARKEAELQRSEAVPMSNSEAECSEAK